MKQFLISISFSITLFIIGGCTGEYAGMNNGAIGTAIPLVVRATASSFDNLDATETRTPTEDGLTTKFSTGDAIGLFALKDGGIVDGVDNLKLTYNETDGSVSWNPPAGKALNHYDGVTYVAYYPYNSTVTANTAATKTADGIKQFLYAHTALQPKTSQKTYDDYTASDLMIATATPVDDPAGDVTRKILTLDLKHQYTLIRMKVHKLLPYKTSTGFLYYPPASDSNLDADAADLTVGKVPAYRTGNGQFRVIIKSTATTATLLDGDYSSTGGVYSSFKISSPTTGFVAGGCHTTRVNGQVTDASSATVREIAVGDFYYQDGGIVPGDQDFQAIADNPCIGIVYVVGVGDHGYVSDYDGKLAAIHGYVLALNHAYRVWGDASQSLTGTAWFEYYGYRYSKSIMASAATGKSYPACSYCMSYTPVPQGMTSGWYFPSLGQVTAFTQNADNLDPFLSKIPGANTISGDMYISATESSTAGNCNGKIKNDGATYRTSKSSNRLTRAVLTF